MSLKSRLPEIEAELRPLVSAAVKNGAELIAQAAKSRAPVASGKLRRSIHVEHVGPAEYSVVAGNTDVFYGHMVEHGTTQSPPHPFLVPAAEESKAAVEALVITALRKL